MSVVGPLNANFDVRTKGLEITFDPNTQQQCLAFSLSLQVSIPQLLQELLNVQAATKRGHSAPPSGVGASTSLSSLPSQPQSAWSAPPQHHAPSQQQQQLQQHEQQQQQQQLSPQQLLRQKQLQQPQRQQQPQPLQPVSQPQQALQPQKQQMVSPFQPPPSAPSAQEQMQQQQQQQQQQLWQPLQSSASASYPRAKVEREQPVVEKANPKGWSHGSHGSCFGTPAAPGLEDLPPLAPGARRMGPPSAPGGLRSQRPAAHLSSGSGGSGNSRSNPARAQSEQGGNADKARITQKLVQAVTTNNIDAAYEAIRQGADVKRFSNTRRHSLLHAALESRGHLEMVNLLIKSQCDVNAAAADGKTPLHLAISKHMELSPMVMRLLLTMRANLNAPDNGQMTPLDCVRAVAKAAANRPNMSARQLLEEVSERPTIAVAVLENQQVLGALFADTQNDKVVFYTESAVGLYSVQQRTVYWKQTLTHLRVQSFVRDMMVNPEHGTIAVFLEVTGMQQMDSPSVDTQVQNLILIWPTGQLQDEEPLKLSMESPAQELGALPPALCVSTSDAPMVLLSRNCHGKVLLWRLNSACSQLISEFEVADRGGLVALSDNGLWAAVVNYGSGTAQLGQVEVWTFEDPNGRMHHRPRQVATFDSRPSQMAIISRENSNSGLVAVAEEMAPGCPPAPIKLVEIQGNGIVNSSYCVRTDSPVRLLGFSHSDPDRLITGLADGLVIIYNLPQGSLKFLHDDADIRSAAVSPDRTLIITTLNCCFRVYKVPADDGFR